MPTRTQFSSFAIVLPIFSTQREKELVGEPLVLLVFGQLVYESVAATAADGVFARHPALRDLERDGGLGRVASHELSTWLSIPGPAPSTCFSTWSRVSCFGSSMSKPMILCVVVAFAPKFEREVEVAPNLFRNRTELGEADTETGQPACAVAHLLPVRLPPRVAVLPEQFEDLGLCQGTSLLSTDLGALALIDGASKTRAGPGRDSRRIRRHSVGDASDWPRTTVIRCGAPRMREEFYGAAHSNLGRTSRSPL